MNSYVLIAVNIVMVLHKIIIFIRSKGNFTKEYGIDVQCVLVTGVHTGVVDALGGLLLIVSDTTTHLHLCELQGVGVPLPVSPDYSLPTR